MRNFLPRSVVFMWSSPGAYRSPVASAPWNKLAGETILQILMAAMVPLRAVAETAVA